LMAQKYFHRDPDHPAERFATQTRLAGPHRR
jgi:hypothetical protein